MLLGALTNAAYAASPAANEGCSLSGIVDIDFTVEL